jgi:hypothetical protein
MSSPVEIGPVSVGAPFDSSTPNLGNSSSPSTNATEPQEAPFLSPSGLDTSLVGQYQDLSTSTATLTGFVLSAASVIVLLLLYYLIVRGFLRCVHRCCCKKKHVVMSGTTLMMGARTAPAPLDARTRFVNAWTNTPFPYVLVRSADPFSITQSVCVTLFHSRLRSAQ